MGKKNEKTVKRRQVEELVRKKLDKQGFKMTHCREKGQNGSDIVAEKEDLILYVDVIGYKSSTSAASRDFYEVFFRAFSRLEEHNADYIIIAMPIQYLQDMKKRIEGMKNAWVRLCIAFPEISVYFVDIKNEKIYRKKLPEILHTEEEV